MKKTTINRIVLPIFMTLFLIRITALVEFSWWIVVSPIVFLVAREVYWFFAGNFLLLFCKYRIRRDQKQRERDVHNKIMARVEAAKKRIEEEDNQNLQDEINESNS